MARKIGTAGLILIGALLQCLVFQVFEIASIKPDILLILTVSFGLMRGRRDGLWTGFFCGLVLDLFFPSVIGFQTLIYMWIGYVSGFAYRIFYDDDIKTPMIMTGAASLVYGLYCYLFSFFLRGRLNFLFYLGRIIIPEALYTIVLTILLYRILYLLNQKMNRFDKRSIDSLV